MSEQRSFDQDGERIWEAKGNSFEVAAEHAAEQALNDKEASVNVGDELVVESTRVVVGPGSHISDYIVRLQQPG
jgi:hypothetical protein